MNLNDYILSGILEQYVLGDVSPQEKQEVECMSHIYPEIQTELFKVQIALEGFAMDNAIEVPSYVKKNIFEAIENEVEEKIVIPETVIAKVVELKAIKNNNVETSINYKKYLAAASVVFIIGLVGLYAILNSNFNKQELVLNKKVEGLEKENADTKNQLATFSLENNKVYVLQGDAKKAPGKSMVVMWNKTTGNVYVNNIQLPTTPTNKQYQLWALKDGKPIDLGVFDVNSNLQNMKIIYGAQAFAVTLENKGGSPTPHLEELYGIVNI